MMNRLTRLTTPLLLVGALALSGCSSDVTAATNSAPVTSGSSTAVAPELRSTASTDMSVVDLGGSAYAVGRGIAFAMGPGWTDYETEKLGTDGTSHEWAVGLPASTVPLPAGVQLSMGVDDTGGSFETLVSGTEQLVQVSPGYVFLDKGETAIPGAVRAAFFRFNRNLDLGSGNVKVEQLQLILDMPGGQVSVLRFIGEAGKWDDQVGSAYDSLVVNEER